MTQALDAGSAALPESQALEIALRILKGSVAAGASDIHLRANVVPMVRVEGELCPLDHPALPVAVVNAAVTALAAWSGVDPARFAEKQLDFSCHVPDVGRFRAHAYQQAGTLAVVLRHIPHPVPDFASLRLPRVMKRISLERRGLVLVTGATGNGKSTTIASMLEFVNQNAPRHIVTLEDPIEYVFENKISSFSQREVGRDVDSFQQGLEGALREDPDVLFIGEIRSLHAFEVALNAAESGRLLISTFHSADATRAVARMIHMYAPDQQEQAANRLADAIAAVVCQRLVPKRGGRDRLLVTETLTRSPTVQDCIRDPSRLRGISAALERGTHEYGTHTFDQQLIAMARDGLITVETAKAYANSPNDLARNLKLTR